MYVEGTRCSDRPECGGEEKDRAAGQTGARVLHHSCEDTNPDVHSHLAVVLNTKGNNLVGK